MAKPTEADVRELRGSIATLGGPPRLAERYHVSNDNPEGDQGPWYTWTVRRAGRTNARS